MPLKITPQIFEVNGIMGRGGGDQFTVCKTLVAGANDGEDGHHAGLMAKK
jgi:hypothetical protein